VRDVKRVVLPEVVRVTIELDGEVTYYEEALENPSRLFFDLRGARLGPAVEEGVRAFTDGDVVREVRVGTHPNGIVRVVLDTQGVARHSLFTLYNPYRLVLDMYREPGALTQKLTPAPPPWPPRRPRVRPRRRLAPRPRRGTNPCRRRRPAPTSPRRQRHPSPTAPAATRLHDSSDSASRAS
jgi:N-acetylmuramoyl-L-alanine amidase